MRKKQLRSDLARIKSVIEGDRKNVSADVENMLKYDLMCVLGGYFDANTPPIIDVQPSRGGLSVKIYLMAKSMRTAGVKPFDTGALK